MQEMQETQVWFLGPEDALEKEMATYSSIHAWKIWWTEESGRLQSMGSQELDMTEQLNHHYHLNKTNASLVIYYICCCCSIFQSCLTPCDPMDCSTPGFPVLHHLPEFTQTHVHWVSDAIQPSLPLSSPSSHLSRLSSKAISSSQFSQVLPKQEWFLYLSLWSGLIEKGSPLVL